MPKTIPSIPKLCHFNYDITKQWYVHFRMNNPNNGERKQFRFSFGINYIKNKQERIYEANALIKALKEKLADGWCPFPIYEVEYDTLYKALQGVTAIKWEPLRPRSKHSYKVVLDIFYEWIKRKGYDDLKPEEFTANEAMQYMDYLSTDKKLTGRTWNNRLSSMKIFFNYLVDRDLIVKNPFRKIKKHPESKSTRNYAYSEKELEILFPFLQTNHKQLYYFCRFVYALYVRPNEAARLQIKDVNFSNWTINIYPDISKTKRYRVAIIPDSYKAMFEEMNLQSYPSDYFIFSKGCKPGEAYNPSFDKLTPKLKKININLGINPMCTMYSFRHSGIIKLYTLLKFNTYECMQITGHTEMASFQNYLKTLGFAQNESFRSLMN